MSESNLIVMSRDELAKLIRSEVSTSMRAVLAERVVQEDWIDLDAAASLHGYSRQHVARMANRGTIPAHRFGKLHRFRRSELDAFLSAKSA